MSKCDIDIEFDREDRTYSGGEPITGRVRVHVNDDLNSKGIRLTHQWRTHGQGNVASGPKETIELATAGPLAAGETLVLPFSVPSATHPVTYHGNVINVDHYMSAEVDIPWASNSKVEEDYILQAGEPPAQFTGSRSAMISLAASPKAMNPIAMVVIGVLLLVLLIPVLMFAILLLPIILFVLGIAWLIRRALISRLGEVQLQIPHVVVTPGEEWPLRIQFHPRKQFPINGIFVTLRCQESAKSGSGTQSTTHTHNVFERKSVIRDAQVLEAGVPVDQTFSMTFPQTTAYSFETTDNKIHWSAEVRIDIPKFPDWTTTQALQVVPAEFLSELSSGAAESPVTKSDEFAERGSAKRIVPISSETREINPVEDHDIGENPVDDSPEFVLPEDLVELAAQICSVSRHGHERAEIVSSVFGHVFEGTIVVDRVNSSIGVTSNSPGYEDGKTIIGTIQGTEQSIQVLTPKSLNESIDDLRRGDAWPLHLTIDGWDNLYNRINARQVEELN